MRERLLRAAAALAAGASIALEHIRDRYQEPHAEIRVAREPVPWPCPMCHGSLRDGPHVHGEDAYWSTEYPAGFEAPVWWPRSDPSAIVITDLAGGDTFVVGGAE